MPRESAFEVEGVVVEVLPNGLYMAELPNGHRVRAFVTGRAKRTFPGLRAGEKVRLQMSPYDLSEGRVIVETK